MFVCAPGQLIEWTNYIGQPLELLMLEFLSFDRTTVSLELQASAHASGTELLFPFLSEPVLSPAVVTGQLYDTIRDSWKQGTASAWLRCKAGLLDLLSLLLSHRERQTEMALEMARLELERLYTSEIAIDSLARIAGHSRLSVWGHSAGTVLYDDLELGMPEAVRDIKWLEQVTPSELSGYQADRILVHVERSKAAEERWALLSRSQEWHSLPVVQSGAVHVVFGYGCFEGPWNEYAAEPIGRLLNNIPELFGLIGG